MGCTKPSCCNSMEMCCKKAPGCFAIQGLPVGMHHVEWHLALHLKDPHGLLGCRHILLLEQEQGGQALAKVVGSLLVTSTCCSSPRCACQCQQTTEYKNSPGASRYIHVTIINQKAQVSPLSGYLWLYARVVLICIKVAYLFLQTCLCRAAY